METKGCNQEWFEREYWESVVKLYSVKVNRSQEMIATLTKIKGLCLIRKSVLEAQDSLGMQDSYNLKEVKELIKSTNSLIATHLEKLRDAKKLLGEMVRERNGCLKQIK